MFVFDIKNMLSTQNGESVKGWKSTKNMEDTEKKLIFHNISVVENLLIPKHGIKGWKVKEVNKNVK